ncbi:cupin domain-containing protein [Luteimonas sp. 8-5]|uniref:cupin domain-containing protein n=1 Tax=Luteimonas sp. 8-5 TaxID=3039387 RepID=UPI00243678FE|nr:cupin domain-containing protein [Luteimonas sp. 8-5]MDG6349566.1 cupin domain-containing protein [Luteimonas sp. 8-5]
MVATEDSTRPNLPSAEEYSAEMARYDHLEAVDLEALQLAVTEPYKNQVLFNVNSECMRLAVFEGEYRWHFHPRSDELFVVLAGELHIEFEDRAGVALTPLQCLVVPAGTVHRTRAVGRTVNITFEQQGAETVFVEPKEPRSSRSD